MEFIFFLGGVVVGVSFAITSKKFKTPGGIIDIDHDNNFYKIKFISKDVVDKRKYKAEFFINHHATISREEQIL